MRYPGGVSKNELEIRLRRLQDDVLRVLNRRNEADVRRITTATVANIIDTISFGDITGVPLTFPPSTHTHPESQIVDLDKYTQAEVDALLAGAGRVGITYRTIPDDEVVSVFGGEQYLVFQELVVEGELIIDGGEVVVLSNTEATQFPLDAFGRVRVSDPITIFDAGHQYNLNLLVWDTGLSAGTGTVTHLPNESAVSLSTGGTASGAKAVLQSKVYHLYQPGKSQLIMCTGALGVATDDVRKRYGYFDADNGTFFEQTSAGVGAVLRSRTTGSVVDTRVEQADWNLDPLDGTGPSKITADFEKAQIFLFDMEWLGVGRVRFGIVLGGQIVYVHEFAHINTLTGPYMTSANLPIRAEIENTALAAGTTTWKQVCASVISEGGQEDDRAFLFSAGNGTTTTAVTTRRPIFTVRPKLTFNSLANRGQVVPSEIDLYTSSNAYYEFVLNGTLTGASFGSAGADSIAEVDVAATAITGGTIVEGGFVTTGGGSSRGSGRNGLLGRLALVLNALGDTADTLSIVATSFAGTANMSAAVTWKEFR